MLLKNKSIVSIILLFTLMFSTVVTASSDKEILVLGNDLTPKMIQDLKVIYGIDSDIDEIIITNAEEHEALGHYISAETITNKSMSSAYIKLTSPGSGINVKTHNINWVTEDMYRNALATAGIKDADIIAAGPFPVSGTAALTGVMKAYEKLTGEKISEEQKDIANDEMVTTAELSDEIGKKEAEEIITQVKIFITENNVTDKETIKDAIEEASKNVNVELTEEQKKSIADLMERLSKLDLDVDQIKSQLGDIVNKLDDIKIDTGEIKGFFAKIIDFIKNLFK